MFRILKLSLELALNNLISHRERTVLTVSSVTLAVIITLLLISFSDRLIQLSRDTFNLRNVQIYCFPYQVPVELGPVTITSVTGYLEPNMIDELEQDSFLTKYVPHVMGINRLVISYRGYNFVLYSMDLKKLEYFYPRIANSEIGSIISVIYSAGNLSKVALIGYKLAKLLDLEVGDDISLFNSILTVQAILPPLGGYEDYSIIVDRSAIENLSTLGGGYQQLWLTFEYKPSNLEEVLNYLRRAYPEQRFLPAELLQTNRLGMLRLLRLLQFSIALIGIMIAFTATTNTLLISTYERLREFGILLALGASRAMVFLIVLWEGMIVCLLGGSIGTVLGTLGTYLIGVSLKSVLRFAFPVTGLSFESFLEIFLVVILLGWCSAMLPAYIASSVNIPRALRWE